MNTSNYSQITQSAINKTAQNFSQLDISKTDTTETIREVLKISHLTDFQRLTLINNLVSVER